MNRLLQHWVREQAAARPEATALVFGQERLTYAELESATNQLARALKHTGCQRGDRVCFLIPKSPQAIIAMLGILKADCMHVPLDTSSPAKRLQNIIERCESRFLLAAGQTLALLNNLLADSPLQHSLSVGWLGTSRLAEQNFRPQFNLNDVKTFSAEPLPSNNTSEDPAHLLFTSSSTGAPKGVVITHANVIHFVEWAVRYFQMSPSDRMSGHPPLHFDLSQLDIFGTFAAGAELHLLPPELSLLPSKLAGTMRTSELTQWFSVPSMLTYMERFDVVQWNDFPSLKRLLWCGEVLPTRTLMYWMQRLPHVTFTNLYGPTETTIASSYYTVPKALSDPAEPIPIGTPCQGERMLVLDSNLQPTPPGEIGNLYIGGVGLSPGYWREPAKTASVFLPDPFQPGSTERIYNTGDLARVDKNGLFHFLGREDTQIKCRGYRIELGEIESALSSLHHLRECAVVAIDSDGFESKAICCAYVPAAADRITPILLREELSRLLPAHMLPSRWMAFQRLPQNANGKIDRPRLRLLFKSGQDVTDSNSAPSATDMKLAAPRPETELR